MFSEQPYQNKFGLWGGSEFYLIVFHLLDEKGLSVVPQLHVQIHRLPIDLHIHLEQTWVEGGMNYKTLAAKPQPRSFLKAANQGFFF